MAPQGSHSCPVRDPAWATTGGQGPQGGSRKGPKGGPRKGPKEQSLRRIKKPLRFSRLPAIHNHYSPPRPPRAPKFPQDLHCPPTVPCDPPRSLQQPENLFPICHFFVSHYLCLSLDSLMDKWVVGWMDGWTDRQRDKQTGRQTNGQIYGLTDCLFVCLSVCLSAFP